MVSIPVETLLSDDEMALDTLARQVRARLQEIQQTLHLDLPVYLVLSKADQLLGFDEFFDQLSREESDQVLGTSFGKEQNGTDVTVLRQAFEDLLRRLNSQVIMRIHQERDTLRRGRILDFPHQLGQIGERLCLFVELAFTGNRYQRASRLRGFYLTSAPHLAQQLDEDTAGIGANLGIASGLLPTLRNGRSRFIHHLLSQVIFPRPTWQVSIAANARASTGASAPCTSVRWRSFCYSACSGLAVSRPTTSAWSGYASWRSNGPSSARRLASAMTPWRR